MAISKKICDRMNAGMKRMRPVIEQQKDRDVSEADTVTLVKDLLADVFGYDKYTELTSEHAIRGTYCDLVVKVDDKFTAIIEVKAIGISLDDRHVKQAVDYAANQGVEWVFLTNGIMWRLYHVIFAKPIDKKLIVEINLLELDCRKEAQRELLYLFTKEGFKKGAHVEMRDKKDATSRYVLAALILDNDSVLGAIRRELRRVVEVNVTTEEVAKVLRAEVIKRDAVEGPEAEEAVKRVSRRSEKPILKKRNDRSSSRRKKEEAEVAVEEPA